MLRAVISRSVRAKKDVVSKVQHISAVQRKAYGSYYDSNVEEPKEKYTGVEKSFAEWKFVEQLMPPVFVPPAPTDPSVNYSSGWKPPNPPVDNGYFIRRSKNHMIPVYLRIHDDGQRKNVRIRSVEGNLWALEQEIGKYLQKKYPKKTIITHVHELACYVQIRGDYFEDVKQWIIDKGY